MQFKKAANVIDVVSKDKKNEQKFIEKFGEISDAIAIENLVPVNEKLNYNKIAEKAKYNANRLGNEICP